MAKKQKKDENPGSNRVRNAALIGAGVVGAGLLARHALRKPGASATVNGRKVKVDILPPKPSAASAPKGKGYSYKYTGPESPGFKGKVDESFNKASKWRPGMSSAKTDSFDDFKKKRAAGHTFELRSAIRVIMFAASPSGDPRPRNRMGQFDQPEQDDPVQQNKSAYDPGKRRRTAAVLAGGAIGAGIGGGALLAKAYLKKKKSPIPLS